MKDDIEEVLDKGRMVESIAGSGGVGL